MADDTRSTVTVAIRRSSKSPAIFLAASFTEPAWEPVELDVKPIPPLASKDTAVQTNGHVPDAQYEFSKSFEVALGKHQYKFREGLEGSWFHDKEVDSAVDNEGNESNVLVVEPVMTTMKSADSPEKEEVENISNGSVSGVEKADEVKVEHKVSKDDASEAVIAEDVTSTEVILEAQDTKLAEDPLAAENVEASEADTTSKDVPELLENPVEDSHETRADSAPVVNELQIVEKEPEGQLQMKNDEGQNTEPAEKNDLAAPDVDEAEPVETEVATDPDATIDDKPPASEPAHTPEPSQQDVVIETPVCEENEENPANAETSIDAAGEELKPEETTIDIESPETEPKVVEQPSQPDVASNLAPASIEELEDPITPIHTEPADPAEPTTAIDAPADSEPAQSQVVDENIIPQVNGDVQKEDEGDKPAETGTSGEEYLESTPEGGIAELDTKPYPVPEEKPEEPDVQAPIMEVTAPESEQLVIKDDDSQAGNVIKDVESQDVNIDKEDEPSGEVANPIAQEVPDDVTPDTSMEPQQQNAELVSEPTDEVAPAEDVTAKAVVNDDTTGVPDNEEPAGAGPDPAAPAPPESHEAAPEPEITPEIPVVSATEEPEAPTSEETIIPDGEPVTQQDVIPDSIEPESLVETEEPAVPDSSDEVVTSKPEDDTALEPEPDTPATPEEPEAPESAADTVPETNANSGEEPEASEPAADLELVQPSTPETEVADEQTTEKVVEPETSKSVDIADPAPDSTPDVAEISTAEEPAAPQLPGDLAANPATTDIPDREVEQTEPETSKPIDGVVAELEPVVQTISTDVLDAPVEKTEPETLQLNGDVVSDLAEPVEVVLPAVPAPSTEVATVETPEAPEELRVPDTTKPADDVVADTAPVSENTASQIADASVEVTDSETLHPSCDDPEPIEPEELAKPIEPEPQPEPEPATEPPPVQAPEVPEDLKEPEDLDPDKDAVIPQPEHEPVPVPTTSNITQASTEPSQPETSIDADNAVTQLDELEPKSAPEAPISEVAEDPTEAVELDASEAIGVAVTKSEPDSVLTASETHEIPPEPTKAEDLPVVDYAVVEPTPEVAPEITLEDAPDTTVAPTTFNAERELEANVDTSRDPESNEPETTIPATGETVGASAVVEESETPKTPEDTETHVAQEIPTADSTEPQAVSAPGLEQEVETPEIPAPMEEPKYSEPAPEDEPLATDNADNITPDHKRDEVVTNGDRTDSTDKEEEQQEPLATELPVVIEDVPEPALDDEPGVSKHEQQISDPGPIAVEEPEHATPAEEPEVEHTAEIESKTNEPSQVTKAPVGLEGSKSELTEIEQPAVDSASALGPPQEPNPPPEIDQDIPKLATEEPSAEPELTPSTNFVSEVLPANEPATKNKSGDTFEPAVPVAVAAETDLEVSEHTKHAEPAEKGDGREPPTAAATLESSTAEIVADELEITSKSKEQPPASDPEETKASESDEPDTRKEFAVEIEQPTSLKTADYPLIESPIENPLSEPVVPHDNANAATEVHPGTQLKPELEVLVVPAEEPFVGTNGTTSKSPVEEVSQAALEEPAVKVAAATLTTALVGAGITQLVSNNEDPVADKDVPSTAPAEVFVSVVETSLSSVPEVTSNGISRSSDKAKEEKAVVNGNNSSPVQESGGGATERVLAPANSQEESLASATEPPELAKQSGAVPSAKQAEVYTLPPTATSQTEPIPSNSGEPEPTNKPSEPAAAGSEPSPAPDATKSGAESGEAEEPRPTTAGDRSVTSITIHKRKNFFKALWHAIFTSFFGGVFSVFRRGRRDTTRQ
ncbi:PT repeat family protein [Histoplasma ohiense]|nr:PT repeat family protein [Histoplasma ohiense (nom. inval.)]